jgi:hypothetical protein
MFYFQGDSGEKDDKNCIYEIRPLGMYGACKLRTY